MFNGCTSLVSINLNNFDASLVTNMENLFFECISLTSLDLGYFKTPKYIIMNNMFSGCKSLKSLNISNLITSSTTEMANLFKGCSSLISLDINNFDTSNVILMGKMFENCYSLISLDLNNFYTSKVESMGYMFSNCSSLIYLNLNNFQTTNANHNINMFSNISNNTIFCFNRQKISNIINQLESYINDCNNTCFKKERKIIIVNKKCLNCSSDFTDKYEFNKYCYTECPNNTYISPIDNNFCIINNINSEKSTNILSNSNEILESKILSEYIESQYTQSNNKNLYGNDSDIITNMENNNFINNSEILTNINTETYIEKNNEIITNINTETYINESNEESIIFKQQMIENIRNKIINGEINFTNLAQGKEDYLIIYENDIIYQITTSNNHKNKEYDNISTIDLGECENILKDKYNIDKNIPLIIYKIDYSKEGLLIPVVGYEIYHPLNNSKLDLNYCNKEKVEINIPASINEDKMYKYDPKSEYYTNDCSPSTSDNGTDILLDDRKNEFINNKLSLCENNCSYNGYDIDTKKAICKCDIKTKEFIISEIIDDNNILANEFSNQSSSSKMDSMKCYKTLFTKDGIKTNYGNYILIFMNILFYILGISFYKFGYPLLNDKIKMLLETKIRIEKNNINKKVTNGEKELKNPIKKKKGKNQKFEQNKKKNKISKFFKKRIKKKVKRKNKENNQSQSNINKSYSKIHLKTIEPLKIKGSNKKNKREIIQIFNDYELNSFSYNQALKYDKRTYFQYYISLIKTKHPLIFSFCPIDDYNSIIIKISIFLLFFSVNYSINRVFFDESTIHKIYEDKGIYNFIYLVPQI